MFVKEITKCYDGKAVVDGVSFEIPKGKVLSLIGPNWLRLAAFRTPADG